MGVRRCNEGVTGENVIPNRETAKWQARVTLALRRPGCISTWHLFHGGLLPFFLSDALPEKDFPAWMDSFWAKDFLELFRLKSLSWSGF